MSAMFAKYGEADNRGRMNMAWSWTFCTRSELLYAKDSQQGLPRAEIARF